MEPERVPLLIRPVHGWIRAVERHPHDVVLVGLDYGPEVHDEGRLVAGHADGQERDRRELGRGPAEEARGNEDQDHQRENREDHRPSDPHLPLHGRREGRPVINLRRPLGKNHAESGPKCMIDASPKRHALARAARKLDPTPSILPKARTPIRETASAVALNRPDESHRNFRSRTKNGSASGARRSAGVACSACVATDRGETAPEASKWRTGYRG